MSRDGTTLMVETVVQRAAMVQKVARAANLLMLIRWRVYSWREIRTSRHWARMRLLCTCPGSPLLGAFSILRTKKEPPPLHRRFEADSTRISETVSKSRAGVNSPLCGRQKMTGHPRRTYRICLQGKHLIRVCMIFSRLSLAMSETLNG